MTQIVARRTRTAPEMALLAVGKSPPWEILIDEISEPVDRWIMELSNRCVSIAVRLDDLDVIRQLRSYFRDRLHDPESEVPEELKLGTFSQARVAARFDDEFPLRCFLVVGPRADSVLFLTLNEDDVRALAVALDQVVDDLAN